MNPVSWAAALAVATVVATRPRPAGRRVPGVLVAPDGSGRATSPRPPARRSGRPRVGEAADVAAWCDALARAIRGGDSLPQALVTVPPPTGHDTDIARLRRCLERGDVDFRSASSHLTLGATVIMACVEQGGPAAEPLDRAAAVLRGRAADEADRRVQSAQARASAVVLTWLPLAMLGLLVATSGSVRGAITTTPGAVSLALGAVLNVIGWRWMRRIIDRAAR